MYLVFIDESGNSKAPKVEHKNPNEGTTLYLTLAATIVDMACMHDIEIRIKELKKRYFKDRRTEAKFSVNKERFKEGMSREDYRMEYAELVRDCDLVITSVVVNKFKASKLNESKQGMYLLAFTELLRQLRDFQASKSFAELSFIVDSINNEHDGTIASAYHEALASFVGTPGFYIKQYSPSIIFGRSTHTPGLQLVDFCAASIQQSTEADNPTYASVFRNKLYSKDGNPYGYGFKWIPKK